MSVDAETFDVPIIVMPSVPTAAGAHQQLLEWANREIARAILGSSLTTKAAPRPLSASSRSSR